MSNSPMQVRDQTTCVSTPPSASCLLIPASSRGLGEATPRSPSPGVLRQVIDDLVETGVEAAPLIAVLGYGTPRNRPSMISISYDLGQHGWSSFKLTVGDKVLDIGPFGFCTDALGDLIRAALVLATSAYEVEVCFDGEPHEWRLCLDEGWKSELRLRVEGNGEILIQGHVTADDFARAVQKAGQGIWETYKADRHSEAWIGQRGFPLRALKALDAAL